MRTNNLTKERLKNFAAFLLVATLLPGLNACSKDDNKDDNNPTPAPQNTRTGLTTDFTAGYLPVTWLEGEPVDINGSVFTISSDDGGIFIGNMPTSSPIFAIYPATMTDGGNNIVVTNNMDANTQININRLAVTSDGEGFFHVCFPMAARAEAGSTELNFSHLTGGLTLIFTNNSGADLNINNLVIEAIDADSNAAIFRVIAPEWSAGVLPPLPTGDVTNTTGDYDVSPTGPITFMMRTGADPNFTLTQGASMSLTIPMLTMGATSFTITVNDYRGVDLFVEKITPSEPITLLPGDEQTLPTIIID